MPHVVQKISRKQAGFGYWARRRGARVLLTAWILLTVAALAGMYRLWWQRERTMYWGKDVSTQRAQVLTRAGIPASILESFLKIDTSWPATVHYKTTGDPNILSYLTYLLIPRIPSGSSEYQLHAEGARIEAQGIPLPAPTHRADAECPNAAGFFLSVFLVAGVALGIRGMLKESQPFPELCGIACLLLMVLVLMAILVFRNAGYGFWAFTGTGLLGWVLFIKHKMKKSVSFSPSTAKPAVQLFWAFLFALGLFSFLLAMLMAVVVVPDDWDAWAIWGAKAKVLALAKGPLANVTHFSHPDYPLLWPVLWSFSGWCAGGWEEHWGKGWGPVFMLLTAAEIYILVKQGIGRTGAALLAGVLFLSVPMVPMVASWGYAEAPLWLTMTGSFGCLIRWREKGSPSQLLFGAILAAAAAYTKNEGVFFTAIAFLWIIAAEPKKLKQAILFFLMPFTVLYLPWFYWIRVMMGAGSHAIDGIALNSGAILRALERLPEALQVIAGIWVDIRQWSLVLWLIGFGAVCALLGGNRQERLEILVPAALLSGFLVIILFHYQNLAWQIGTSWNRLTLQASPLFILALRKQAALFFPDD